MSQFAPLELEAAFALNDTEEALAALERNPTLARTFAAQLARIADKAAALTHHVIAKEAA